ncbi:MAG: YdbL family protein [Gammaproteobacteria bacterium]
MKLRTVLAAGLLALAGACVTVNVYFPAAAAESAADRLVKEIYGIGAGAAPAAQPTPRGDTPPPAPAPAVPSAGDGAMLDPGTGPAQIGRELLLALGRHAADAGQRLASIAVPAAHAQEPDINIATAAIESLKNAMAARHEKLRPYYASGAVGLSDNGLIAVRDAKDVPIRERAGVNQLVSDENRDRNALYAEVANANGHPEWERRIRESFDRRWVANAPSGWWFVDASGNWRQKQ